MIHSQQCVLLSTLYIFFAIWRTFLRSFTAFLHLHVLVTEKGWELNGWEVHIGKEDWHYLGVIVRDFQTLIEDLHFAFLRKTWWWRERQLQDGRGREVTLNRSIKTQAEANTIDTNHKSHITCEHFLGPDKIWETKPTQTACDSLPDTPRY
jgi:hypothetical protein